MRKIKSMTAYRSQINGVRNINRSAPDSVVNSRPAAHTNLVVSVDVIASECCARHGSNVQTFLGTDNNWRSDI